MMRVLLSVILCVVSMPVLACSDLASLQSLESAKLLENAPTFRHGWEDKTILLAFSEPQATAEGCKATLQLTLPQQDLDEVNAYLNDNPAKRILLAAQGYSIPEAVNRVDYFYRMQEGKAADDNSSNTVLKSLHNNVEYMYQSLAQQRIALKKGMKNTQPWDESLKKSELAQCMNSYTVSVGNLEFACNCRVDNLSRILTTRQMELVHFIEQQPYSAATGALASYTHTSKEINEDCSNLTKK